MHTIQLQIIPLRKVCRKGLATLDTAIAAAVPGAALIPAATTSLASRMEPKRLPAHEQVQFLTRFLEQTEKAHKTTADKELLFQRPSSPPLCWSFHLGVFVS